MARRPKNRKSSPAAKPQVDLTSADEQENLPGAQDDLTGTEDALEESEEALEGSADPVEEDETLEGAEVLDEEGDLDDEDLLIDDDAELDVDDDFIEDETVIIVDGDDDDLDEDEDDLDEDEDLDDADDDDDEDAEERPRRRGAVDDDLVPFELQEDQPDPSDEPKTGLVSEFRDLTFSQASWLVSNREATSTARGPLFIIPALLIAIGVIAGLFVGTAQERAASGSDDMTVALMGIPDEDTRLQTEQQIGMSVLSVDSAEAAQEAVLSGEADAALLQDTTGTGGFQVLALDEEPTALLDQLQQPPNVVLLQQPLVSSPLSDAIGWGLALILLLSAVGLGTAMFSNLRVERRNRIGEIIAATIPPAASSWGRVYGVISMALIHLAIGYVLFLLGMSIAGKTAVVMALLPLLGWFAGLFLTTVFAYASLLLISGTAVGQRARKVGYGISTGVVVLAALAPIVLQRMDQVVYWMSFAPFTSPTAMTLRVMAGSGEWWEPAVALGIALLTALIIYFVGQRSYAVNLLRGAGRSGRVAVAKRDRKAAKKKAASTSSRVSDGDDDESDDDDLDDDEDLDEDADDESDDGDEDDDLDEDDDEDDDLDGDDDESDEDEADDEEPVEDVKPASARPTRRRRRR